MVVIYECDRVTKLIQLQVLLDCITRKTCYTVHTMYVLVLDKQIVTQWSRFGICCYVPCRSETEIISNYFPK